MQTQETRDQVYTRLAKTQPDDIADEAFAASKAGDHRQAEWLFLLAAERAVERTNSPTMQKHAQRWDKCAARERRLHELIKSPFTEN